VGSGPGTTGIGDDPSSTVDVSTSTLSSVVDPTPPPPTDGGYCNGTNDYIPDCYRLNCNTDDDLWRCAWECGRCVGSGANVHLVAETTTTTIAPSTTPTAVGVVPKVPDGANFVAGDPETDGPLPEHPDININSSQITDSTEVGPRGSIERISTTLAPYIDVTTTNDGIDFTDVSGEPAGEPTTPAPQKTRWNDPAVLQSHISECLVFNFGIPVGDCSTVPCPKPADCGPKYVCCGKSI